MMTLFYWTLPFLQWDRDGADKWEMSWQCRCIFLVPGPTSDNSIREGWPIEIDWLPHQPQESQVPTYWKSQKLPPLPSPCSVESQAQVLYLQWKYFIIVCLWNIFLCYFLKYEDISSNLQPSLLSLSDLVSCSAITLLGSIKVTITTNLQSADLSFA